ncbi:MAG: HEAT repeat domain-containing protein [Cyanobacteria bacterium P01_D01_bin.6]
MGWLIGLILGLLLGAAIAYFLTAQKAAKLSASVQDLKRQLALAESEHERRLRETTEQLRRDYAAQPPTAASSAVAAAPATHSPVTSATPPTATSVANAVAERPVAVTPTKPLPTPTPKSVEVKPPVTPTAVAKPPSTVQIAQPNDLLAASYASDVATRQAVVQAIAATLPTSGAPAQARWLPILGRLARDAAPTVRLSAIQALKHVKPSKRLPLLRRALQDPDPAVVRAASTLINQTKGYAQPAQAPKKRRLPKNK